MTKPDKQQQNGQQQPKALPEKPKAIEQHAEALNTPAWLLAAAKAAQGWAAGQEITETEYRKALGNAEKEKVG